jgi:NADPH-dependent glutamate synthase beta subunit-like oxidoreductase
MGIEKQVEKRIGTAPCTRACPAGVDVPRYLRLIIEGRYGEAVAVNRERIPFPSVCAYACVHPCQSECQRGKVDQPILIRALKRVAVDNDRGNWRRNYKRLPESGKKAAVIGSGPAGLTAAYYLNMKGHQVTVYEELPQAGGYMRVGIPAYRLPKELLDRDIEAIEELGVIVKTNRRASSLTWLEEEGFDAVLLALGAHKGVRLPLPGADLSGVLVGTAFLRDVSLGEKVSIGKRIIVLGGGSVAFDCARTARRLGAESVFTACLECRGELPALPEEFGMGVEEGISILPGRAFKQIIGDNNQVSGVEFNRVRGFSFDAEGNIKPDIVIGSEHIEPADTVIFAVGYLPDLSPLAGSRISSDGGRVIETDPETLETAQPGVFAAGDAATGPLSIIDAIATGRLAAEHIDRFLGGNGDISEILTSPLEAESVRPAKKARGNRLHRPPKLKPSERLKGFSLEELPMDPKEAVREAQRCLRCDLTNIVDSYNLDTNTCVFCGRCIKTCYWDAIIPDATYPTTMEERQPQRDKLDRQHRIDNLILTLLVTIVAAIVLVVVYNLLLNS